ncbi:hypothetical protein O3P69_008897 [Scylla paramamosain]|uniref:Uncharacterized protein n=1 Tax=Scylla paramamosain TaxID=85552 RepID=A0AAW0TPT5_SCYPA
MDRRTCSVPGTARPLAAFKGYLVISRCRLLAIHTRADHSLPLPSPSSPRSSLWSGLSPNWLDWGRGLSLVGWRIIPAPRRGRATHSRTC